MTTGLLILLNAQVLALLVLGGREQLSAFRSREQNAEYQEASLDAQLATWARAAGRKRPVVAGVRADEQQPENQGEPAEDVTKFSHPSIVLTGQDGA